MIFLLTVPGRGSEPSLSHGTSGLGLPVTTQVKVTELCSSISIEMGLVVTIGGTERGREGGIRAGKIIRNAHKVSRAMI